MLWTSLLAFPIDLITDNVLGQLSLEDLCRLDEAWPANNRDDLYRTVFSHLPAVDVPFKFQGSNVIYSWIFRRCLRIKSVSLRREDCRHLQLMRENCRSIVDLSVHCEGKAEDVHLLRDLGSDHLLSTVVTGAHIGGDSGAIRPEIIDHLGKFTQLSLLNVTVNQKEDAATTVRMLNACLQLHTFRCWQRIDFSPSPIPTWLNTPVFRQLTSLHFLECWLTDDEIILLADTCSKLENLSICSNCREKDAQLHEHSLVKLAKSCRKLKTVSISTSIVPNTVVLRTFLLNCRDLQRAIITGSVIDDAVLTAATVNCPHLTTLSGQWTVTSIEIVLQAAPFLRRLEELYVTLDSTRTNFMLESLIQALSTSMNLRCLSLTLPLTTPERVLDAVAQSCRRLQYFSFRLNDLDGGETAKESYRNSLVNLVGINQSSLTEIFVTGDALSLEQWVAMASKVRNLELISVPGHRLDDDALYTLAKNCPKLQRIVSLGPKVTDRAVLALAQHCRRLTLVNLSQCVLVTEAALLQLVQRSAPGLSLVLPDALPANASRRISIAIHQRKSAYHGLIRLA